MYLGSPRMAEMVIGETVTLEEMGGARMHATVSGCGDNLADDDARRDRAGQAGLLLPAAVAGARTRRTYAAEAPARPLDAELRADAGEPALRHARRSSTHSSTTDSFFEIKPLFAAELVVGLRPARRPLRRHRRQQPRGARRRAVRATAPTRPRASSGGATRSTCRCVYLADVPGFMIGSRGRAPGHHPPRREDDHRGQRGHRAAGLGGAAQGVRRRPLRDGRPGLRARRVPGAADREHRGDGAGGGRQRRVRQQDRRDRRRRPSAPRSSPRDARRVRGRRRPAAPRRATSSSTPSSSPGSCAARSTYGSRSAARTRPARSAHRRHGVPPV